MNERIVAIGLLTATDIERLGGGFSRAFPVPRDDAFADLLRRLDQVEVGSTDTTITLRRPPSDD